jgi:class 3 adenylate cyclase/tetratricopeptide (TPR) repeat protein
VFNKSRVGIHAAVVAGSVLVCGVLPEASADVGVQLRASKSPNSPYGETVELYSKSYALVIGIDDYTDGWPRLSNAVKDARAVADALTKRGFDVTLGLNLNSRDMKEAFERFFILRGQDPDARLFTWYAGHGETIAGQGFLVPADAPLSDATAEFKLKALPMRRFSEYMRLAVAMHVLAVFDSCFSGTVFENQRGKPPAAITAATARPVRQFLSSGDAGQQVSDDGRFRDLFLRGIAGEEGADANADGYVTATELGFYITDRVTNLTEGSQTPRYGKLRDQDYDRGDFVFMAAATPARADTTAAPAPPNQQAPTVFDERQLELAFWQSIQDSGNPADFEAYLESYPRSTYAGLARNRLRVLGDAQRGASAPRTPDRAHARAAWAADGPARAGACRHRRAASRAEPRGGPEARAGAEKRAAAPETDAAPDTQEQGERRQITVMFCDLVGSTQLAKRLDPEDLRALMRTYQRACGAVVERYEGHVAQYLGDGIMAYFGWPRAHEDDAERALRAGLDVVVAVSAIEGPEPLSVRVGISTGIVVVGESDGVEPSQSALAVGETPHLAARLQSLAEPNTVVISQATNRLISGRFELEDLGPRDLKGFIEPVHVFQVLRVRTDASRFDAAHPTGLIPLVGRRSELELLYQRWLDAKDGDGQVVFVSGVPGIGKSRIVHELAQRIVDEPHHGLELQCSPHHGESAFFPVIEQIERMAGMDADDSAGDKFGKLEKLVSPATQDHDSVVPLLAELLSISSESRSPPRELSAQRIKDQTLSALVELLLGLAATRPLLCVLEDAQWVDPSTQEFLDLLAGQIGEAQVLLIVTHRPEYRPHLAVDGNVSALTISRLGRSDVAEMAKLALRTRAVPDVVMERVIAESDSIPLFVEELARGAVDLGFANDDAAGRRFADPSASWSVPETLRDSLMARLDLAPRGRTVAQMAAVVGREFSYDLLRGVSSLDDTELEASLAGLEEHEIVRRIDARRPVRYAFRHALLRDSAYESLLKSSRRRIHGKVAAVIERDSPDIVANRPGLLAYHYSQAGNSEFAVRYWLEGGERARSRSANLEAIGQFQKALEYLHFLPETAEREATELKTQLSLGVCFIAVRGYEADDTRKSFERACVLSAGLGESTKEIQAISGLWGHYWMRARHDRALELGKMLLVKAEPLDDPVPLIVGNRALGSTLFTLGDFVSAREHLEQALSLSRQATAEDLSSSYAVNPQIAARLMLGWDLWILGYPDQALDHVRQAFEEATDLAHPYSVAFTHYVTSAIHLLRGEPRDSIVHADRSLEISREHRINLYAN